MIEGGQLWAIGYDAMDRAEQVREELARLGESRFLTLLDTAVAVRYPDGCLTLNGERFVSIPRSRGHTFASFITGLALGAPPLTGLAAGALVRATGGTAAQVGIDEGFVNEVQTLMKPGSSALFVLDEDGDMPAILRSWSGPRRRTAPATISAPSVPTTPASRRRSYSAGAGSRCSTRRTASRRSGSGWSPWRCASRTTWHSVSAAATGSTVGS